MINLSSAMANQFVEMINGAVSLIEALGPNPLRHNGMVKIPNNDPGNCNLENDILKEEGL
jgi:hypothetical protein